VVEFAVQLAKFCAAHYAPPLMNSAQTTKPSEYEVKAAEYEAKVDRLELAERSLVEQDHYDEALRRRLSAYPA